MPSKTCTRCRDDLPLEAFRVAAGRPVSYCRPCEAAYKAEWRVKNIERILDRRRAQYHADRDENVRKAVDWAQANPERRRANARAYTKRHPEVNRANVALRALRVQAALGKHSEAEWVERQRVFGHRCAYCRDAGPLTRDHVVPIARGGANDIDNILPACSSCNRRKNTRTAAQFLGLERAA